MNNRLGKGIEAEEEGSLTPSQKKVKTRKSFFREKGIDLREGNNLVIQTAVVTNLLLKRRIQIRNLVEVINHTKVAETSLVDLTENHTEVVETNLVVLEENHTGVVETNLVDLTENHTEMVEINQKNLEKEINLVNPKIKVLEIRTVNHVVNS